MFEALEEVARQLEKDIPRAVVLTGAGDIAFCSGFDLGMDNPMTEEFLGAVKKKDMDTAWGFPLKRPLKKRQGQGLNS